MTFSKILYGLLNLSCLTSDLHAFFSLYDCGFLSRFNRDCAFNNIYLQVYWEPKEALDIVQNNKDDVDPYLTLEKDETGYPCVSLKDISSVNEVGYSMKVSSTNLRPEIKFISLKIRKNCSFKSGNTECRKSAKKFPCYIDFIFGCKRFYKCINFDLKFAQGTVIINRD